MRIGNVPLPPATCRGWASLLFFAWAVASIHLLSAPKETHAGRAFYRLGFLLFTGTATQDESR